MKPVWSANVAIGAGNDRKAAVLERLDIPALLRELFPVVEVERGDQVKVNCCFHGDDTPSLSVNTAKGLFNCFGCPAEGNFFDLYMQVKGCDFKAALNDLEARAGILCKAPTPAAAPTIKPRRVATFTYTDENGKRLYIKERWEPARDGKRSKEFFFSHFDKQGKKQPGYKGLHVLYRLPEIVKADQVFILEGEKKADLLSTWGLAATCLDTGAESKWKANYTQYFTGKNVVIVPDQDQAGEAYLQTVARALQGVALSVRVLRLPGLNEKQDVIDWAQQHEAIL